VVFLVAAAAPLEVPFRPVEVAAFGILFFPVEDVLRAPLVLLEVDLEDDLVRPLVPFDDLLTPPFALPAAVLGFFVLFDELLEEVLRELLLPLETAFCEPLLFEVALWPPFLLGEAAPWAPLALVTALLGPLFPPGAAF
jgi:hypothetical protein